ncbi:MAG: DUF1566 domain-containing protein [Treponematales bacterium]
MRRLAAGALAFALALGACPTEGESGGGGDDTAVSFLSVTADGGGAEPTTQITLTFSAAIAGLTAIDIALFGVSGVSKGRTLSGAGPEYTLPVTVTQSGTLTVAVSKSGCAISPITKTVDICGTAVAFQSVMADGSGAATTTRLTLTFSAAIAGLTAGDITLSGVDGAAAGTLTSDGGEIYTLDISGFTRSGILTAAVSKEGYRVSPPTRTVFIYYAGGTASINLTSGVYSGYGVSYSGGVFTIAGGAEVVVTGSTAASRVVVNGEAAVTLNNASITRAAAAPFELGSGANVTLKLVGGNSLVCTLDDENTRTSYAGLQVGSDSSVTIEGPGSLTARGGVGAAGIGSGFIYKGSAALSASQGGAVTITGGEVTAAGGMWGAGIGGGAYGDGGNITISGGTVRAAAGTYGAGIGGGVNGGGGTISINSPGTSRGTATGGGYEHGGQSVGPGSGGSGGSFSGPPGELGLGEDGFPAGFDTYTWPKTAAPTATVTTVKKVDHPQKSVSFTLTSAGTGTWKVYGAASGGAALSAVTAAFNAPALTLTASGSDLEAGTYYVSVTEGDSPESDRLALTVTALGVGDTGPAGGTIFYDKGSGGGGWRYLEAAPEDLPGEYDEGSGVYGYSWGGYGTTCATGTAIGTGAANTEALAGHDHGTPAYGSGLHPAARACAAFTLGGKNDWFLPSKDELDELYNQRTVVVEGFRADCYWSSSESGADRAWLRVFTGQGQGDNTYYKYGIFRVRPVRRF